MTCNEQVFIIIFVSIKKKKTVLACQLGIHNTFLGINKTRTLDGKQKNSEIHSCTLEYRR